MTWSARYRKHLRSAKWRYLKARIINSRGHWCERCGLGYGLELHHKTYERLGDELITDVELLCDQCHRTADEERAQRGAIRSRAAMYSAGLDTYASKKYGDNWETWSDMERIEEEYDGWLERKLEY